MRKREGKERNATCEKVNFILGGSDHRGQKEGDL